MANPDRSKPLGARSVRVTARTSRIRAACLSTAAVSMVILEECLRRRAARVERVGGGPRRYRQAKLNRLEPHMIWSAHKERNRDRAAGGRTPPPPNTRPGMPQGSGQPPRMPPRTTWVTFLVILALNYFVMRMLFPAPEEAITIPYTVFKQQVEQGNVESIYSQGASIEGRFAEPVTWPTKEKLEEARKEAEKKPPLLLASAPEPQTSETFTTTLPAFVDPGLESFLLEHGVEISAIPIQNG